MTSRRPPSLGIRAVRGRRAVLGEPVGIAEVGAAGDAGSLALYSDPAYYTKAFAGRTEDVEYYVDLARRAGGPVLEYGVGNGRIAIPMARAGLEVTGIDLSVPMLDDLRRRLRGEAVEVRRRVTLRRGDMRAVRIGRRFRLVLAPFNAVLHLYDRKDVERFLARVRAHLAPGGRFVFDFSIPRPADLELDPDHSYGSAPVRHPTIDQVTRYAERFHYDPLRQLLLVSLDFTPARGEAWSVPLTHRQFFPREMEALLHYNGFVDIEWTADFTGEPPDEEVDTLVVSCRKRRARAVARGRRRA